MLGFKYRYGICGWRRSVPGHHPVLDSKPSPPFTRHSIRSLGLCHMAKSILKFLCIKQILVLCPIAVKYKICTFMFNAKTQCFHVTLYTEENWTNNPTYALSYIWASCYISSLHTYDAFSLYIWRHFLENFRHIQIHKWLQSNFNFRPLNVYDYQLINKKNKTKLVLLSVSKKPKIKSSINVY